MSERNPITQELDPAAHRRLHAGWIRSDDGRWWKRCRGPCAELKPIEEFYARGDGQTYSYCRRCHTAINRTNEGRARARKLAQRQPREARGGVFAAALCLSWCAAPAGDQAMLVDADSERFFVPPYVGHRGWLGVRLDRGIDWEEIAGIVEDAFCEIAPKRLVESLRD